MAEIPLITDEIVLKAIVAKGGTSLDEGIGVSMHRALNAVAQDIINMYFYRKYVNNHLEELMGQLPPPPAVITEVVH